MDLMKEYLEYIALLEFDLSKTLANYENKIAERMKTDKDAKGKTPEQIINQIIDADPTTNKQYHQWMIKQYLINSIKRSEDFGVISELLTKYKKLIDKKILPLELRDINKIKTTNDLFSLINKYWQDNFDKSKKETKSNEENELIQNKEAKIIYNSPTLKVVIPKTQEASCYFGKNTKWCTAAKNDNRFGDYNSDGPLYIVLFKKENKRFQFHFESNQFMDELDEPIDIKNLFDENPELYEVNWQTNNPIAKLITTKNPSEEIQIEAVYSDWSLLRFIENPSEKVQITAVYVDVDALEYIKNPSEKVQLLAVNRHGYAIRYIKNPSEKVQLAAVNENGYAIEYIKNPSEKVKDLYFKKTGKKYE